MTAPMSRGDLVASVRALLRELEGHEAVGHVHPHEALEARLAVEAWALMRRGYAPAAAARMTTIDHPSLYASVLEHITYPATHALHLADRRLELELARETRRKQVDLEVADVSRDAHVQRQAALERIVALLESGARWRDPDVQRALLRFTEAGRDLEVANQVARILGGRR